MRRLLLLFVLLACGGCFLAACGGTPPVMKTCTATSCSGCCTTDDRCITDFRERDNSCGFNGATCVNCTAQGKVCDTTQPNACK